MGQRSGLEMWRYEHVPNGGERQWMRRGTRGQLEGGRPLGRGGTCFLFHEPRCSTFLYLLRFVCVEVNYSIQLFPIAVPWKQNLKIQILIHRVWECHNQFRNQENQFVGFFLYVLEKLIEVTHRCSRSGCRTIKFNDDSDPNSPCFSMWFVGFFLIVIRVQDSV